MRKKEREKKVGRNQAANKKIKSQMKEESVTSRFVSQGTIRSAFKSLRSEVNWTLNRKPPRLAECRFMISKITATTLKPFLPTEEIKRLFGSMGENE